MSKNDIYEQFKDDLLTLYCKVKTPSVEDVFIRFASTIETVDFKDWVKANERNLRSQVGNFKILDLLILLSNIRENLSTNDQVNKSKLAKYIFSAPQKQQDAMAYLWAFDSIIKEGSNRILTPFAGIVDNLINTFKQEGTKDANKEQAEKESTLKDLKIIHDLYINRASPITVKEQMPSIKKQKVNMFQNLLSTFQNEISGAYEAQGMNDQAQQIKGGLLARSVGYGAGVDTIINLSPLTPLQINSVESLVNEVLKKSDGRWISYNHDLVENVLLREAGAMSPEEFRQIQTAYEKNKDILEELKDDDKTPFSSYGTNATVDQRLNPKFIHLLSLFFGNLKKKLSL
jgi:hypothetical protein